MINSYDNSDAIRPEELDAKTCAMRRSKSGLLFDNIDDLDEPVIEVYRGYKPFEVVGNECFEKTEESVNNEDTETTDVEKTQNEEMNVDCPDTKKSLFGADEGISEVVGFINECKIAEEGKSISGTLESDSVSLEHNEIILSNLNDIAEEKCDNSEATLELEKSESPEPQKSSDMSAKEVLVWNFPKSLKNDKRTRR